MDALIASPAQPGGHRAAVPPPPRPLRPLRPPALPEIRHWSGPGAPRLEDLAQRLAGRGLTVARCTAPAGTTTTWPDPGSGAVVWLCSGWLDVEWEDLPDSAAAARPTPSLRLGPGDRLTLPPGTGFRLRVESDVPAWYVVAQECELC